MAKATCSLDGCGAAVLARGWCSMHYARWRRTGDPYGVPVRTESERFWEKVNRRGPVPPHASELGRCWVWTASVDRAGYGQFGSGGTMVRAHRYAYREARGRLPAVLDHRCHNPACVRPTHLRPASGVQNNRHRSGAPRSSSTGVRGVTVERRTGRYAAHVTDGGRQIHLGTFATVEDAADAAAAKRAELWGTFAGLG